MSFEKYEAMESNMTFVPNRLSVPLFLLTRKSLSTENPEVLRNYISKKIGLYTSCCGQGDEPDSVTIKHFKHLAGMDKSKMGTSCGVPNFSQPSYTSHTTIKSKSWHLPPNLYSVEEKNDKKPCYGALWKKLPTSTALIPNRAKTPPPTFYDLPSFSDLLLKNNRHKGIFQTDPRSRRATTRSMITNTLTCYRNPNDPGPATYSPYKKIPKCIKQPSIAEPHTFLPHTTVPIKYLSIHKNNTSFTPGPGTYDNRFNNFCGCSSNLKYAPDIQLEIDKQKRNKFRLRPYTKIGSKKYYTPEWRHVKGNGFQRLFKIDSTSKAKKPTKPFRIKKAYKRVQMYPDGRYIKMINAPARTMESTFRIPITKPPKPVHFNCIVKRVVRKQLRNNKKLAFGSSSERFKDTERTTTTLTFSQLESIKNSLPLERQLRDLPVMRVNKEDIVSNLFKLPAHYQPANKIRRVKRQFKFAPLPEPKILVTEKETHRLGSDGNVIHCKGFYTDAIDPRDYFRADIEDELLQQYNNLLNPEIAE